MTFPTNESSLTFPEQWLLCLLMYGLDKAPRPMASYGQSREHHNDQFYFMNNAMMKAWKIEPATTASTATADGTITSAGHYSFPLGRYMTKAGMPGKYLSGHRELLIYINFWQNQTDRLLYALRQNPRMSRLNSKALKASRELTDKQL